MFLTKFRADGMGDRSPWGQFWFSPVGMLSGSGARVTAQSAMALPIVFSCIRVLAESFAVMPFVLYQPKVGGGRTKNKAHWLYRLFAKSPNRFQTPYEWRLMLQGHLALRGNAFCQITTTGAGEITDLLPLHPDRMSIEMVDGGSYRYKYTDQAGTVHYYQRGEIWHLRGMSDDGLMGMSPISLAREAIGEGLAIQAYSSKFFANDAKPGGWLELPGKFANRETKQVFREDWQVMQGGENRGKVAVLESGMKYHEMGLTNKDSQFVEARIAKKSEIASIWRLPPHKVGDLSKCMPADTLVFTTNGPQRIVDVKPGDEVWSFDGEKVVAAKVLNNWENGVDEILQIRTTNRTVRCNAQHRLMVRRRIEHAVPPGGKGGRNVNGKKVWITWENVYIPAGKLQAGDTLLSLGSLPDQGRVIAPNGRALTIGFMEFAGLLAGDGNVFDWGVSIARCDKASYMPHYREVMRREFICGGRKWAFGTDHHMARLTDEQVAEIRALAPRITTASAIARQHGAYVGTVCRIDRGGEYRADHAQATIDAGALAEIKRKLATRLTTKEVAARFGVDTSTVSNIISGRSWVSAGAVDPIREAVIREGRQSTSFSSVLAADELRSLGLSGTAFTKTVPDWVFGLAEELRLGYLRGIVDSDGSVNKKGRISVSLVNRKLIDQIRHLCMSCGVPVTNVRTATVTTRLPSGKRHTTTMHTFTCSDPGANSRIGSHDGRYIERLKNGKPFGRKDRKYPRFGGKGFDSKGLSLSRIVSIKRMAPEPVYDIKVEKHHCFIADGIVSHNSSFSNIEQMSIEFWTDTMLPYAELWESSIEYFLLGEDTFLDPEFNMRRMMRGDSAARSTYYQSGINTGWLTRNEAREEEGYDPIDGLDEPLRPLNMVEESYAPDEIAEGPGGPEDDTGPADDGGDEASARRQRYRARQQTRRNAEMRGMKEAMQGAAAARVDFLLQAAAARLARRTVKAEGKLPTADVIAEAMTVPLASAEAWLAAVTPLVDLTEDQLTASLVALGKTL
jgi:HK97 family phage portal protein